MLFRPMIPLGRDIFKRLLNLVLGVIFVLTGSACITRRPVVASQPGAAASPADQGLASFTILTGTDTGTKLDGSKFEEVFPPRPIGELKTPIYPDKALKAGYGQATVAVRVFLDATGTVTEIRDAPNDRSTGRSFALEFRSAVENAIHQWSFQPAEYRQYEEGKDLNGDGKPDYMVVIATKQIPVYFDVRFDFSIIKGHAYVK